MVLEYTLPLLLITIPVPSPLSLQRDILPYVHFRQSCSSTIRVLAAPVPLRPISSNNKPPTITILHHTNPNIRRRRPDTLQINQYIPSGTQTPPNVSHSEQKTDIPEYNAHNSQNRPHRSSHHDNSPSRRPIPGLRFLGCHSAYSSRGSHPGQVVDRRCCVAGLGSDQRDAGRRRWLGRRGYRPRRGQVFRDRSSWMRRGELGDACVSTEEMRMMMVVVVMWQVGEKIT